MRLTIFSYRYAREILEHENNRDAWDEIIEVVSATPIFIYPNKSRIKRLEIVQQLMNTYFDRRFSVDLGWQYHPLATKITNSGLAADFRKQFSHITVQAEVQFGNAARWYSDIFKFQAAYAQSLIQCGLCILPMGVVARKIDQNVASFERAVRELPSADLSITLPILIIGIEPDEDTPVIDVSTSRFTSIKEVIESENRWRLVNAFLAGQDVTAIGPDSPIGPMLSDEPSSSPEAGIEDS